MKKRLLLPLFLLLGAATFAQNVIVDFDFNRDLIDNSVHQNHLEGYGSGQFYSFIALGATNLNTDTCVSFMGGQGLVTDTSIDNSTWAGAAISFWINSSSQVATTTTGFIIQGAYAGFGVKMNGNGSFVPFFGGTSVGIPSSNFVFSFTNLGWHHVVAQNDGTTTYLYVDGALDRQFSETIYRMPGAEPLAKMYLGTTLSNDAQNKLDGFAIDELKVFDNILSPSQIQQLILHQDISVATTRPVAHDISVFPNPSNGLIQIQSAQAFVDGHYTVLNPMGQIVAQNTLTSATTTLQLPAARGLYYVKLLIDGQSTTHKIIKQ